MFYILHEDGKTFAKRVVGELVSPRHTTEDIREAWASAFWHDASDINQNFGPEWHIEEV